MKLIRNTCIILIVFGIFLCKNSKSQEIPDSLKQQILLIKQKSVEKKDIVLQEINNYINKFEKDTALSYWDALIECCNQESFYQGKANFLLFKAIRLKNEGEYPKSKDAYLASENTYSMINYKPGLARVYNGLGILYQSLNKFELSLKYFIQSAELFRELGEYGNQGRIYLNLGGMYEKRDSLQLAKKYLYHSKQLLLAEDDTTGLINCYINLGNVYSKENSSRIFNKMDSVFYFLDLSYNLSNHFSDLIDKFYAGFYLGMYFFDKKNANKAKELLLNAYDLMNHQESKNLISIDDKALLTKYLSDLYILEGKDKESLIFLTESLQYNAEFKLEQSKLEMTVADMDYQEQKSQADKTRLETILYFSISVILISFLLIFTLYRNYRNKQKANRLLKEMDELKNHLYSNITHELRTPLTLILGPLDQIISSESRKKPSRKQVKMMLKNAKTLLNLVNQMLDLSKLDAKSLKLELVKEDISKFIRVRLANFISLAEQKGIQFSYQVSDKKDFEFFDGSKLEKIINNLVSNAIKYTPQNGRVICSADFTEYNLNLKIQDSGKGIPENELNKIFDRFHQIADAQPLNQIGTGIGLSLTKELVDLMHGKIEVQSNLGEGSIFKISFPLGKDHLHSNEYVLVSGYDETVIKTEVDDIESVSSKCNDEIIKAKDISENPLVFIVEDHIEIREYIGENLKKEFSVCLIENGKKGLKEAIENIPDLIITDLAMPEMDGIELCKAIKSDERTSHIPVIILTAKANLKDKLEGLKTGADAYLSKPFSVEELRLRSRKLIEQRKNLRKLFTKNINLEPKDIAVTSTDEKFLTRALEIIEKHMGDSDFEVREFQEEMFMSRMQLFRKLKALTNQSPTEFIRITRLKRASKLLEKNFGNITQVAFEVGFSNPSYFSKCFKELYGMLPSEYNKKNSSDD